MLTMNFHLPELPTIPNVAYGVMGFVTAITVAAKLSRRPNLDAIPAVGSTTWLGSWWASFLYLVNAQNIIQHGYEKHKSAPFKVPEPQRWTVIVSNREHIEEIVKASDVFSFAEAINDQIQVRHLLGPEIQHNPYHIAVIRFHLTRNLDVKCLQIRDEIVASFADVLDLRGNEWKGIPASSVVEKVICRTTNRVFVGLPLCRDPDWIDLTIRFAAHIITGGVLIGLFPKFMRTLAARHFTSVPQCINRGMKSLGPIIEERRKYLKEYGAEWDDKPNDLLSWLMEEEQGTDQTLQCLTTRLLAITFGAIHTTSNSFTHVLLYLAAHPQYIQPLREEVEVIVEKDGWSKTALGKMQKLDSFLKECLRMEGMVITSLSRKALRDFTFSDGTFIPKGTMIAAATLSLHHDEKFYANPDVFEPFRFVNMHEENEDGPKYQLTSTSSEYLAFGLGKHACPGRFFAATELKLILAHIVVTYDIKLEDGATRPLSQHIATFIRADPRAKIMFRHRVN